MRLVSVLRTDLSSGLRQNLREAENMERLVKKEIKELQKTEDRTGLRDATKFLGSIQKQKHHLKALLEELGDQLKCI